MAGEPAHLEEVADVLDDLARRLEAFRRRIGHAPATEASAPWVEALGWFAGWRYPATAVGDR